MSEVNVHDLEAIGDIADWIIEESDSLSTEKSVELLVALRMALNKMKLAVDMLEAQALRTIEQPVVMDNRVWAKKPSFKKRPDFTVIAARVVSTAIEPDHETGEMRTPEEAAERAVRIMRALYVSPSTVPKTTGVRNLGLEMDDITREEHVGFELRRTDL